MFRRYLPSILAFVGLVLAVAAVLECACDLSGKLHKYPWVQKWLTWRDPTVHP